MLGRCIFLTATVLVTHSDELAPFRVSLKNGGSAVADVLSLSPSTISLALVVAHDGSTTGPPLPQCASRGSCKDET
ncbi:uncharacterized protein PHACADRAFT_264856 [Phanerochaete carnosa HHB-10118-sp]|uniref:Secreted protein n=1 Tax=Phanerochaete carnosa (strain HHB-10118-sp) TaxID=650164 RepID=K5UKR2_PHACS|nr:uncharacterized protein PHACADRAFT_264856 [Phanerochaete carnosa HHB-10118-sp]EKM50236.1 hypothetical protein PHACADRAFT_264856 [Phanerochaete carnosa HHB-10118-sp]